MKHIGVHMNLFKRVRAFQIKLEFGSVGFWEERKTGVPGENPLGAKGENQQQTQPTYSVWRRRRELNPGHIGGRQALSPLRHQGSRRGFCMLP